MSSGASSSALKSELWWLPRSEEDDLWASQPGALVCTYTTRCDVSVVLIFAEVRFRAEQWVNISGGEVDERWKLWETTGD